MATEKTENDQQAESTSQNDINIVSVAKTIEAVLFAAGYPIALDKLAETLSVSAAAVDDAIAWLCSKYTKDNSGLQLIRLDQCIQLCTREEYASYVRDALGIRRGGNLSRSSLEVLAIIAYNQPVTKSYIEEVRSVDSSYTVNSLVDKKLIEPCGTLDTPGKPTLYRTTPDFLRVFGLTSIYELPPFELFDEKGQVLLKP